MVFEITTLKCTSLNKPMLVESHAKAYAEALKTKRKEKMFIELETCATFSEGAIISRGIRSWEYRVKSIIN